MLTDKQIIMNLSLDYCEGESEWLLSPADESRVGDDIE